MPIWNPARERAQRMMVETYGVPLEVIADATGRSLKSILNRAEVLGWKLISQDDRTVEKLRNASTAIARRVETMLRMSSDGEAIDKGEMDALNSAVRVTEKLIEILSPDEFIQDSAARKNEDLAEVLERINQRIIELAGTIAADMASRQSGRAGLGG